MAFKNKKNQTRVNEGIRSREVRVISEDGSQLGIMNTKSAVDLAFQRGFDLVEVQPNSKPPVCRIMDYGKYKYEKSKKAKAARKKQHTITIKEIRFSSKISEHDYGYKMKHIREFLLSKDKVKVTVRFRGREITHTELGAELLDKVKEDTKDIAQVESESKMEGRVMTMMLAPDNKRIKSYLASKKSEKKD